MGSATTKAIWTLAIVACLLGTVGHTQTIIGAELAELARVFRGAVGLIAQAIVGVDRVEARQIPNAERSQAIEELRNISRALSNLSVVQMPLVQDLSSYSSDVRLRGFDPEKHGRMWREILLSVASVSNVVSTTVNHVETSRWLQITFNESDRLALREVLFARNNLLEKLRNSMPPRTPEDLDQLDQLSQNYRQLIASLHALNIALTRATDRVRSG